MKKILALGLNFATAPQRVPVLKMLASTEATAHQLNDEAAAPQIESELNPPHSQTTKEQPQQWLAGSGEKTPERQGKLRKATQQ